MNKCNSCKFISVEFKYDLDKVSKEIIKGSENWIGICDKGIDIANIKDTDNCSEYIGIEAECSGCHKLFNISELEKGFHSEECRKTFISGREDSISRSEGRIAEIQNRLKELENSSKNYEEEICKLQEELVGHEYSVLVSKQYLKSFL